MSSASSAFEKVQVGPTALSCCTDFRFVCVLLSTPEPLLFNLSQNRPQLTKLQTKWKQKLQGTSPFLSCSWWWRLVSCVHLCLSNLSTNLLTLEIASKKQIRQVSLTPFVLSIPFQYVLGINNPVPLHADELFLSNLARYSFSPVQFQE